MTVNEKIKKFRKAAGLTQDELAQRAGYKSHSTIAKIEKGELDPPATMIAKLAGALGVSGSDLLDPPTIGADALSEEERRILAAYREADEDTKTGVALILKVKRFG